MASLIAWLAAGALAAPGVRVTDGFASGHARVWLEGPPHATVVLMVGPSAAPCQPKVGQSCLGFNGPAEIFGTVELDPGGRAEVQIPLRANLEGATLAIRPLIVDGPHHTLPPPVTLRVYAADQDPDGDFLATVNEEKLGTDPERADSDRGGVPDGKEVAWGTNPTVRRDDRRHKLDSDRDGIPDDAEERLGTDPYSKDSDGDGIDDRIEVEELETNPGDPDTDGGGIWDGEEIAAGTDPHDPSDDRPVDPKPVEDRDRDGLPDDEEEARGTDPDNPDSDGGGALDGFEVLAGFDPTDPSDDHALESDIDEDGLPDRIEERLGTDVDNPDTDGGGMGDADEFFEGRDPHDPTDDQDHHTNRRDSDFDGVPDDEEERLGLDPHNPDTDGGGAIDGYEVFTGHDPLDPKDDDAFASDRDKDELPDIVETEWGTDPDRGGHRWRGDRRRHRVVERLRSAGPGRRPVLPRPRLRP